MGWVGWYLVVGLLTAAFCYHVFGKEISDGVKEHNKEREKQGKVERVWCYHFLLLVIHIGGWPVVWGLLLWDGVDSNREEH